MKTLSKPALLSLLLTIVATGTYAAKPRAGKHVAKPIAVNIQAVVDSALIMADDYATAMAQKPEFAPTRLNILRNYYTALPTDAARDSVRSRIFDFYVNYVEEGKAEQAEAFKSSFMSIASNTDEHLGPLYANELTLARERFDTTAVKTNIDLLEAYANRMNYDYDDDLASARQWLHTIRTRKPIKDILPGVWVSEDIWKDRVVEYEYKDYSLKAALYHPGCITNSLAILKIPRAENPKGELVVQKCKGMTMDIPSSMGGGLHQFVFKLTGIDGYIPIKREEIQYYNLDQNIGMKLFGTINTDNFSPHSYSKTVKLDNDAYGAYIFWGDENLKRPNTEIASFVRQSVQNTQALIAGHLSRSQYSTGERIAGNFFAGLSAEAINSVIDYFMVSTERLFCVETILQIVNPYELKAKTYIQVVLSKSNEPQPHSFNFVFESTYYRWEPSDDIAFMGPYKVKDAQASALNMGGVITISELPKEQSKAKTKEIKKYCDSWKKNYKEEIKSLKASLKAMPKGPEKDAAKKQLKDYKKTRRQCWNDYNEQLYLILKAKSDNYRP